MEVSRFVHAIPRGLMVGSLDGDPGDRGYLGGWQPTFQAPRAEPPPDDGSLRIVRDEDEGPQRRKRAPTETSESNLRGVAGTGEGPAVARVRAQLADRFSDPDRKEDSGSRDRAAGEVLRTASREVQVEYDSDIPPRAGQPVRHASFGRGRLVGVSLGGREPIAQVRFESGSLKSVALRFLTILGRDDAGDLEGV